MKANNFPSLTWNFLKINNAEIEKPEGLKIKPEVSLAEGVEKADFNAETFDSIKTGMGSEFDAAFDELKIGAEKFSVAKGKQAQTVRLEYNAEKENSADEVLIHAEEGSQSNFIFVLKTASDFEKALALRVKVIAEDNAKVRVGLVNLCGKNARTFVSFGSRACDNALVETTEIILGGKDNVWGNHNALEGYKSKFNGHNAYVVNDKESLDINYVSLQKGRETESTMNVDGVVGGTGKKTWRGTIDFKNGCAESKGDEQENVLLLDPKVVNKSLPVILCDEEAVEGRHGASIGRLGKEILFYMQSRGVDEKTAENLIIRAKINTAARSLGDEKTAAEVLAFVPGE